MGIFLLGSAGRATSKRVIYHSEAGLETDAIDAMHENASFGDLDEHEFLEATKITSHRDKVSSALAALFYKITARETETSAECRRDDSGSIVGCNREGCSCGWSQQCYPMYESHRNMGEASTNATNSSEADKQQDGL